MSDITGISRRNYILLKYVMAVIIFMISFYIAWHLSLLQTPDEVQGRYPLCQWIFSHGRLPTGKEEELRIPLWGFSYATTPYLPQIIGAAFMKLASVFSTDEHVLLTAARCVSVLSVTGLWLAACAIGELSFKNNLVNIFFASICCMLPQILFLSGYVNNDCFGAFLAAVIVYFWIRGDKNVWDKKTCILLGISLGLLALTYYNDYSFILGSVIFYCCSCYKNKLSLKEFFLKGLIIFSAAFVVAGWFFIRNFMLNDGDFIGIKTREAYGEMYGRDDMKPSNRFIPANLGMSFREAFLEKNCILPAISWTKSVIYSFIGVFGYITVWLPEKYYYVYFLFFGFFLLMFIRGLLLRKVKDGVLCLILFLCSLITIGLSMKYSFYTDFQPQGRYIIALIVPLAYYCASGCDSLVSSQRSDLRLKNLFIILAAFGYWSIGLRAIVKFLMPYCF